MDDREPSVWMDQVGGNGNTGTWIEGNVSSSGNPPFSGSAGNGPGAPMQGGGMPVGNGPGAPVQGGGMPIGNGPGAPMMPGGMPGPDRNGMPAAPPPMYTAAPARPPVPETEETKRLKQNYGQIVPVTFAYAVFYAFCMFRNGSGVTFPLFVGSSLLFFCFCCRKLGLALKRGSSFYMAAILLLGISTFCTDDSRIIFFNKTGVFLLTVSLLLKQYFDTSRWQLGKYIGSVCELVVMSFGELGRPVTDGADYGRRTKKPDKRFWFFALGLLIGIPLLLFILLLLASADAVFRQMTRELLENINLANIVNVLFRITFMFFASYALTAYLCKRRIREEVTDWRRGEPVLAITVTGLLTVIYLLFSGIQIMGLFLGKLQLPYGYTYAKYAREGFFQLLVVSMLNLIIVLVCMSFFRESKILKMVLAVMSACTFVMIASSAMRMVIYIKYYYLTFLRILVLWALAVLAALFVGVVANIFRRKFPLFRYSMAVVTILYLALAFARPDYVIAKVNIANAPHEGTEWQGGFFQAGKPYQDYEYLKNLCADAAPVLVPYLEELGYHLEAFYEENPVTYAKEIGAIESGYQDRSSQAGFGYYWMVKLQGRTENFGLRTYNVSRHMALRCFRAR